MKQLKASLKLTILLMVICLMTVGCQKDDTQNEPAANQVQDQQGLKVIMTNWKHFSEDNTTASKHISKLQAEKTLSRNTTSEEYGFIIDTSRVQVIEQEGFTTYAFYIMRPELNSNIVENYVYKEYDNGDYSQYLLTYNCVINEDGATIHDAQSLQVTPINDSSLLSRSGCEVQLVDSYDQTVCEVRFHCTGEAGHEIGDDCPCGTAPQFDCIPPGMSCYITNVTEWSETCPGGNPDNNPPDPNNPGGGTGTTTTYTTQGSPTVSYPVQHPAFYNIIECINGTGFGNLNDTTTIDPTLMFGVNLDWKPISISLNEENNCSEDAQVETIAIIELINGMDKECQAIELVYSIYKVNSTFTNKIKNYFITSSDNKLNFQDLNTGESVSDEPTMPANIGARVLPEPSSDGTIILQFNNDHLDNATSLGYVNTFYHELVHAYILHLYHSGELLNEYPGYTDLKIAMDNFFNNSSNTTLANIYDKEMHDIYIDFIDQIAESIVAYCDYNNINGVDLVYAKKFVWGGLNGYDVFYNNLTPAQRLEAQTLLAHENFNNTSNAKGTKTCN